VKAEEALEKIRGQFGDAVREAEVRDGTVYLTADGVRNFEICRALHGMGFEYLDCLSGVDWKDRFEVVYNLSSLRFPAKVHLRATTSHDDPRVRSVASLWATANWHEREAWDLLGIRFDGHPDLRRILLPEDWVGHPLRRDYVDEGRYVQFTPYGEAKKAASQAAHGEVKAEAAANVEAKAEAGAKPAAQAGAAPPGAPAPEAAE
jgi:NADH-quinone oxidoreductase subunit C